MKTIKALDIDSSGKIKENLNGKPKLVNLQVSEKLINILNNKVKKNVRF